jgi:hypothetical protein
LFDSICCVCAQCIWALTHVWCFLYCRSRGSACAVFVCSLIWSMDAGLVLSWCRPDSNLLGCIWMEEGWLTESFAVFVCAVQVWRHHRCLCHRGCTAACFSASRGAVLSCYANLLSRQYALSKAVARFATASASLPAHSLITCTLFDSQQFAIAVSSFSCACSQTTVLLCAILHSCHLFDGAAWSCPVLLTVVVNKLFD